MEENIKTIEFLKKYGPKNKGRIPDMSPEMGKLFYEKNPVSPVDLGKRGKYVCLCNDCTEFLVVSVDNKGNVFNAENGDPVHVNCIMGRLCDYYKQHEYGIMYRHNEKGVLLSQLVLFTRKPIEELSKMLEA